MAPPQSHANMVVCSKGWRWLSYSDTVKPPARKHLQVRIALIAVGVLLTGLWAAHLPWDRMAKGQNDFLGLYEGAKLAGTPDLYSAEAQLAVQHNVSAIRIPSVLYSRPPFYALLLWPLGRLDYPTAYWAFQSLSALACVAFFGLFRTDRQLLWLAPVSIPVLVVFINGQDVMLIVLALAASLLLERRGQSLLAGLALSFCLIKFHFFIFIPLALIGAKRWRMLVGAALGTAFWLAAGTIAQGPNWPVEYFHFLQQPVLHPAPFGFPNLRGLVGESGTSLWVLEAVIAALLLALAWQRVRFETMFAMCLLGGFLTSYHAGIQDCCLLFVAFYLATDHSLMRTTLFALLTPPAYYSLLLDGPASRLFAAILFTAFLASAAALMWKHRGIKPIMAGWHWFAVL